MSLESSNKRNLEKSIFGWEGLKKETWEGMPAYSKDDSASKSMLEEAEEIRRILDGSTLLDETLLKTDSLGEEKEEEIDEETKARNEQINLLKQKADDFFGWGSSTIDTNEKEKSIPFDDTLKDDYQVISSAISNSESHDEWLKRKEKIKNEKNQIWEEFKTIFNKIYSELAVSADDKEEIVNIKNSQIKKYKDIEREALSVLTNRYQDFNKNDYLEEIKKVKQDYGTYALSWQNEIRKSLLDIHKDIPNYNMLLSQMSKYVPMEWGDLLTEFFNSDPQYGKIFSHILDNHMIDFLNTDISNFTAENEIKYFNARTEWVNLMQYFIEFLKSIGCIDSLDSAIYSAQANNLKNDLIEKFNKQENIDSEYYRQQVENIYNSPVSNETFDNTENEVSNLNNVKKYDLHDHKITEIDNFGIYDFFKYHDNVYTSKLIAAIWPHQYVINHGDSDKCDHYGMHMELENQFGNYKCFLGSGGLELNVFVNSVLDENQIEILIRVFAELKAYYLETNKNKNIAFIGEYVDDFLKENRNCDDIDKIIDILYEIKNRKKQVNDTPIPVSKTIDIKSQTEPIKQEIQPNSNIKIDTNDENVDVDIELIIKYIENHYDYGKVEKITSIQGWSEDVTYGILFEGSKPWESKLITITKEERNRIIRSNMIVEAMKQENMNISENENAINR